MLRVGALLLGLLAPAPHARANDILDALRAALAPADGPWLFFVTVNLETGETRFATTIEEHNANVALFQQYLREHPEGK